MGHGGAIHVQVTERASHGSSWVVVRVSDTGPGIPESVRTHIFDPFFTTKPHGSGLGFAICRGIMDAHHGTIRADVDSNSGHGTSISVEFPSADNIASLLTKTRFYIEAASIRNAYGPVRYSHVVNRRTSLGSSAEYIETGHVS
jgi:hypothetical protein